MSSSTSAAVGLVTHRRSRLRRGHVSRTRASARGDRGLREKVYLIYLRSAWKTTKYEPLLPDTTRQAVHVASLLSTSYQARAGLVLPDANVQPLTHQVITGDQHSVGMGVYDAGEPHARGGACSPHTHAHDGLRIDRTHVSFVSLNPNELEPERVSRAQIPARHR